MEREFRVYGKTRAEAIANAASKGSGTHIVALSWPPLPDSDGWSRLQELTASHDTVFMCRTFEDNRTVTRTYEEFVERYFRFVDNATDFDRSESIHAFSSTMRTCKECQSHVAVALVPGECCPVCGADMRSATVQNTIDRWISRIEKVEGQGTESATRIGWLGGWICLAVEGTGDASDDDLCRRYDSFAYDADTGAKAIMLDAETYQRLQQRAEDEGVTPVACIRQLLD